MTNRMIHTPEGVRDIYGMEFARKRRVKEELHQKLSLYGYEDIQTPAFEFFDIFSREVGTTPSRELYKFFDKEGNTLVLRPDFTPSIARCAAKYFMDDAAPIRLCYEGNVFTNGSELQGKLKETTQLGAELIGEPSVDADAEMLCMVVDGLKACGFEEFQVSIGEMNYFKGLCEEAALSEETLDELRSSISAKNYFGAEELLKRNHVTEETVRLLLEASEISSIEELGALKTNIKNERSLLAIERLEQVYELMKNRYGMEKYISFDLGMLSKFHYYTGIIFKAYFPFRIWNRFFLSKGPDVPTYVEYGAADIGVVGKDTIMEEGRRAFEVLDLGFGKCRMCVCGPASARELLEHHEMIRVASKYPRIAKDYFHNQRFQTVDIIKLNGSVELGPIVGLADVIVDIVETGSTLRENGLEVLEEICPLSARMIVNQVSMRMENERIRKIIGELKELVK